MNIVEYNDSYAQQVADMWNKSGSNWGDDASLKTAAEVISEESKSGNIKLYLAIDNDQVVGYCSFSEYQHDEGASYLPLLNVRPDYHGKKVGKQLILKVLENAVASKWPRFDLFTWSGNIKAMPLYKKCGFFWEKNNNTVHLMNFIPYLYQTEAFTEYMNQIDWYQDSKRVINMEQDGNIVNGFDYFRYDFENNFTKLAFEFEKSGRGLRFVETPDYKIEMTLPKHKLVYDQNYDVTFKIVNKSGKPLEVGLQGVNNKMVTSTFNSTHTVEKEMIVTETFTVSETNKTQDKMKTFPCVITDVTINGKKAQFKLGLEPKSPVSVKLKTLEFTHILGREYDGYLELENNLEEKTTFDITMDSKLITIKQDINITLDPKEKRSIQFQYDVKEFGFIDEDITLAYNGKTLNQNVKEVIKGYDEDFYGETETMGYLVSGNYTVLINKQRNNLVYKSQYNQDVQTAFLTPQIGMPYSLEFANKIPTLSFEKPNQMDVRYDSDAFYGVSLIVHVKNLRGIMEVQYELVNNGDKRELALMIPIWQGVNDAVIPYNNKLLQTNKLEGAYLTDLEADLFDENWIYSEKHKVGLVWDKTESVKVSAWKMSSVKEGIVIEKGESYKSGNYYVSYAHNEMKELRAFAGNKTDKDFMKFLEVNINDGNPFVNGEVKASLISYKKVMVDGVFKCDEKVAKLKETLSITPGLKTITIDTDESIRTETRQLFETKGNVSYQETDEFKIIDNGVLTFKASEKYADAIISLKFNNHEWLDSNYPEPKERAWWGTFSGGINTRFAGIQDNVVLEEPRTIEYVTLKDNFNNEWKGLKLSVSFEKDEDLKGLVVDTYVVTLPGLPVVHTFGNITNNTGKLIENKHYHRFNVLQLDDDNKKAFFTLGDIDYKCGNIGTERDTRKLISFKSTRDHKMVFYNKSGDLEIDTQSAYTIAFNGDFLTIPDQTSKHLVGDFIIFTKEDFKPEHLQDLNNIKFEV